MTLYNHSLYYRNCDDSSILILGHMTLYVVCTTCMQGIIIIMMNIRRYSSPPPLSLPEWWGLDEQLSEADGLDWWPSPGSLWDPHTKGQEPDSAHAQVDSRDGKVCVPQGHFTRHADHAQQNGRCQICSINTAKVSLCWYIIVDQLGISLH